MLLPNGSGSFWRINFANRAMGAFFAQIQRTAHGRPLSKTEPLKNRTPFDGAPIPRAVAGGILCLRY